MLFQKRSISIAWPIAGAIFTAAVLGTLGGVVVHETVQEASTPLGVGIGVVGGLVAGYYLGLRARYDDLSGWITRGFIIMEGVGIVGLGVFMLWLYIALRGSY